MGDLRVDEYTQAFEFVCHQFLQLPVSYMSQMSSLTY